MRNIVELFTPFVILLGLIGIAAAIELAAGRSESTAGLDPRHQARIRTLNGRFARRLPIRR
ncbi:hypothetical protein [Rhizobium sp. G21]|uniref:hypothetical protein n=1 Tax=Rhizobium sp. G21 TaxID=2758439 RepID=UPI001602960F|nr:hypothetical protein [Rhizobium sp. G21]MBB1250673.1 hypothetical protein [Rhizobium sp. G21]